MTRSRTRRLACVALSALAVLCGARALAQSRRADARIWWCTGNRCYLSPDACEDRRAFDRDMRRRVLPCRRLAVAWCVQATQQVESPPSTAAWCTPTRASCVDAARELALENEAAARAGMAPFWTDVTDCHPLDAQALIDRGRKRERPGAPPGRTA